MYDLGDSSQRFEAALGRLFIEHAHLERRVDVAILCVLKVSGQVGEAITHPINSIGVRLKILQNVGHVMLSEHEASKLDSICRRIHNRVNDDRNPAAHALWLMPSDEEMSKYPATRFIKKPMSTPPREEEKDFSIDELESISEAIKQTRYDLESFISRVTRRI